MFIMASSYNAMPLLVLAVILIVMNLFVGILSIVDKKDQTKKSMLTHCPECNSTQIEYITEYHKCLSMRLFNYASIIITVIAIIFLTITNTEVEDLLAYCIIGILLIAIITAITKFFITLTESKTHIRCICRNCGHTWTVN